MKYPATKLLNFSLEIMFFVKKVVDFLINTVYQIWKKVVSSLFELNYVCQMLHQKD